MKQEKIVHNSSLSSVQNTYDAGNYIYTKGSAQSSTKGTFFHSEEGYIEPRFGPSFQGIQPRMALECSRQSERYR